MVEDHTRYQRLLQQPFGAPDVFEPDEESVHERSPNAKGGPILGLFGLIFGGLAMAPLLLLMFVLAGTAIAMLALACVFAWAAIGQLFG